MPSVLRICISKILVCASLLISFSVASQAQPSLTLKELLNQANLSYPALQAVRLETRAALEELDAARRLYWPTVNAVIESNSSTTSATGPTRTLQVEQTLWDAGNVKSRIAESDTLTSLQTLKAALLKEEVYLQLANAWQNMLASKDRMEVAKQTIARLQVYQQQMQRRVRIETSPRIDLELANSRILQTQVEHTAALNNLKQAISRIEQYSGRTDLMAMVTDSNAAVVTVNASGFSLVQITENLQSIIDQHPSVSKARAESLQSQNRLDQKKSEAWPQIYARISQPLSQPGAGYNTGPTAFIGIRYSTSTGFVNQLQAKALATRALSAQEMVASIAIDLRQTLQVDQDEYLAALSRISALEKSVQGSDLVLVSYLRQFQAGKKTWQDLLNAVRELAQNQYALADARASMQGAIYRLQIRTGQEIQ